jgi:phosphoribosylamine--glycine ligase
MAAGGYPGDYDRGLPIRGLGEVAGVPDTMVFHAGTRLQDGQILTNGGRVLCVTALGETVTQAQAHAYALVERIRWQDAYYRRDIGYRALRREMP